MFIPLLGSAAVIAVWLVFKLIPGYLPPPGSPGARSFKDAVRALFHSLFHSQPLPRDFAVNFHFTRQCNFSCGFCFHTALTSHVESFENIKIVLRKLKDAGMRKINFAGGEPFLNPKLLAKMVRFCKEELKLVVSIVSNGSLIKETWIKENAKWIDMLAISCDSFNEDVNGLIGRTSENKPAQQWVHAKRASDWCYENGIRFKINTVVNAFNWEEDMTDRIRVLDPYRWKIFQCLLIKGENTGDETIRDARRFLISDQQFKAFEERHAGLQCLVPEDNTKMRSSYLILDEYLRFLDCSSNSKIPGRSLLEVDAETALREAHFDQENFEARNGAYYKTSEWLSSTAPDNVGPVCSTAPQGGATCSAIDPAPSGGSKPLDRLVEGLRDIEDL